MSVRLALTDTHLCLVQIGFRCARCVFVTLILMCHPDVRHGPLRPPSSFLGEGRIAESKSFTSNQDAFPGLMERPEAFLSSGQSTLSKDSMAGMNEAAAVQALWQRLRSPEARFQIMVSLSIFDPE
jgi:hypothetical protein